MKLIMENWRGFLNEGIDDRLEDLLEMKNEKGAMGISISGTGKLIHFYYTWFPFKGRPFVIPARGNFARSFLKDKGGPEEAPYGQVVIQQPAPNKYGQCDNAYIIHFTSADKGWGPLLYEAALEWATENGGGLTPDRREVSAAATAVWDKYLERGDVDKSQLDVLHYDSESRKYPKKTPDNPKDDCVQDKSIEVGVDDWADTPHSKLYKKDKDIISRLASAKPSRWRRA